MVLVLLALLQIQGPTRPDSTLWTFRIGQEFFVEETQRHLLQAKGATTVTSYFDYTLLWRYLVSSEKDGEYKIQATLEKVRVNNPNEAGGRASEKLKSHEGERSNWLLKKDSTGWSTRLAPGDTTRHAVPLFLTLGTAKLDSANPGWKQQWDVPVSRMGEARIVLDVTVKQQTTERVHISSKGSMEWLPEKKEQTQVSVMSQSNPIAGLGEYDLTRGRWLYFEWRAGGSWEASRGGSGITLKQDIYVFYRYSERRPTFP